MNTRSTGRTRWVRLSAALCVCLLGAVAPAQGQVVLATPGAQLTIEAFGNVTAASGAATRGDDLLVDAGARLLGRLHLADGPDIGIRVTGALNEQSTRIAEGSVLLFGSTGRLEIGQRMGLPDVLTGYAPNNFQFTSAEFGPASGLSLDPSGGLQTSFLKSAIRDQVSSLAALGVTAALFDDQSPKVLYVSPKKRGWLVGASYANDADTKGIQELFQAGITHERYVHQSVLRWGATYAYGKAPNGIAVRNLRSIGTGVSFTLDDALTLGIAGSFDGTSRLPTSATGRFASAAWGASASVNYNTGRWTVGGYYQWSTAEGSTLTSRDDRLSALELGCSYRLTTKFRLYGAWYHLNFNDDDRSLSDASDSGNILIVGMRLTL